MLTFILSPISINIVLEKKNHKQGTIMTGNSSYIKIVLVLLVKLIAIQVHFPKV